MGLKCFPPQYCLVRSATIALIAILVTGCAASGSKFSALDPVNKNFGQVYFYRMANLVGSANPYEIYINDEKKAVLKNSGYLKLDLLPGQYSIAAKPSITSALSIGRPAFEQVTVEPGKRYFFWFNIGSRLGGPTGYGSSGTLYVNPNTLVPVSEEIAVKHMSELRYSED